jgi:hypothetical protein
MTDGLDVQVPVHAVAGAGTLVGAVAQAPAPAPSGMQFAGPVYRLEVTGARLTEQVRLTVPVPSLSGTAADGPDAALLAYYDNAAHAWVPVEARYDAASGTLTALTPHLSVWTVLRVDTGKLLDGADSLLKGFLDISSTTGQPSCPGQSDLAAVGVKTASDKGDLVKWCAGVEEGQPLLRVADNRYYAMEADYPDSWAASHVGDTDPLTAEIVADIAKELSPAATGGRSVIIPGGEQEQFVVPAGAVGQLDVRPSSEAFLIDALVYGADTLQMTMDDIPGTPAASPSKTASAISLALQAKDCVTEGDNLIQTEVTSATTAGQMFRGAVEWAVGCLADEWKEAYGLSGAIGSFVVSIDLWLADGIRLVVDGMQEAIDGAVYWRSYRIAIGSSGLARFVGSWYVHDGDLCVGGALQLPTSVTQAPPCQGDNPVGWEKGYTGCTILQAGAPPVCEEWDELSFASDPDGTVTATITKILYTTTDDSVIQGLTLGAGYDEVGDTYRLTYEATGLLVTTFLHTHLSQSDLQYGNPYWCGSGISVSNQPKCGALQHRSRVHFAVRLLIAAPAGREPCRRRASDGDRSQNAVGMN